MSSAPRSSRFSSCSLPRLRSQPIQRPSPAFQTRRRCSSRKRSPPGAGAMRRLSRAMPAAAAGEQRRVAVRVLGRGVGPVGQQGEMEFAVGAGEIVDLQPRDLLRDRRVRGQQGRHGDRACAGAPGRRRRSSRPGSIVAPNRPSPPRLTQRHRGVERRDAPGTPSSASHAAPGIAAAIQTNGEASRAAATSHDGARIAADAERAAAPSEPGARRRPVSRSRPRTRRPPAIRCSRVALAAVRRVRRHAAAARPARRGGRCRVSERSEPRASSSMALR